MIKFICGFAAYQSTISIDGREAYISLDLPAPYLLPLTHPSTHYVCSSQYGTNDNNNILFDHNLQIEITIYNSLDNQIINTIGLENTIKTK